MSVYEIYYLDLDCDRLTSEALLIEKETFDREYISNLNGGVQIHNPAWEKIFPESYIQTHLLPTLTDFLFKRDTSAVSMVTPADGPSLGIAPAGM